MTKKKLKDYPQDAIIGHECRHVVYCPPPEPGMPDLHLIKRVTHVKEGDQIIQIPNVVAKKDFERKFWIERPGRQNHREKREFAEMEDLIEVTCTESQLVNKVRSKLIELTDKSIKKFNLPFPGRNDGLRNLARSPYLYGTDVLSTTLVKKMYMDLYPHLRSPSSMAATDTETNMFSKEQEIIMQTISFKDKVFTVIKKSFVDGLMDVENRLQACLQQYLGEIVKKRNIKWEIKFVDTAGQIVVEIANKAHEWMPDFLAIWNIKFDMIKMLEALKADNLDPAQVFSHPTIPKDYKHFEFKLAKPYKEKADKTQVPLAPSALWHKTFVPASFYFIDAMCAYRQIRTGQQEEPSYSLGDILEKHLGVRKLNFKEADGFKEKEWHLFMQEFYKLEYVVYNVFDCVGMEMLDEKTNDLSLNFPLYAGPTDYESFNSQPKKLCNKFFFTLLEENRVLASTSDQMTDDNDLRTPSGKGWITMLPAHLTFDNGLQCMEEMVGVSSNIRAGVGDLDIAGTYPNEGICMNIAKYTTHRELLYIEGIPDHIRRRIGFNIGGGHVNALEVSHDIFKMPTPDQMLAAFLAHKTQSAPAPVMLNHT